MNADGSEPNLERQVILGYNKIAACSTVLYEKPAAPQVVK